MLKNLGLKYENKYFVVLFWFKFMFEIFDVFKFNGWLFFILYY